MISSTGLPIRREIVAELSGLFAVDVSLDGIRAAVTFEPDIPERERRSTVGAGAVTSLALLHGLWMLPEGCRVPARLLPPEKVSLLVAAPELVELCGDDLIRRYQPAGRVRVVGLTGRDGDKVIDRAIRCSPIFERYALLGPTSTCATSRGMAAAREWGVGVVSVSDVDGINVLVPAELGVVGVPSVYRWWVSELAYAAKTAPRI